MGPIRRSFKFSQCMETITGEQNSYIARNVADLGPTRYYAKRPFIQDPRLALLPANLLKDARVLDIGCNEGFVTCEIGGYPLPCRTFFRVTHPEVRTDVEGEEGHGGRH